MKRYAGGRFAVMVGDITTLAVDAIVNAATRSLLGGGGVDGAIHRAAGPKLLADCRKLGGAMTGEAKITGGHKLPAKFVIHTPGPVWEDGLHGEDELLARSYESCLKVAAESGCRTVAFPAISTGACGFPKERAAHIAIGTVVAVTEQLAGIFEQVIFCCHSETDAAIYEAAISEYI